MNWLLLGYSHIAMKRIVPALKQCGVNEIDIASKTRLDDVCLPKGMVRNRSYSDYEVAIKDSKADIVYISTVNSLHTQLAEIALLQGKHVVVDKPAFMSLSETKFLVDVARKEGLCLAEATTYAYHSVINEIKSCFLRNDCFPTHINATFSFPPMAANNFRYSKNLGGGALHDLGSYTASIWRLFFGELPLDLSCEITGRAGDVETSYSCMAIFSGGRSMLGHFGFTTGYSNHIELLGSDIRVSAERIFTLPADMECAINFCHKSNKEIITLSACDQFSEFLREVISSINGNNIESFAVEMLQDAQGVDLLRGACGE